MDRLYIQVQDMLSKLQRCRERAPEDEHLSGREMEKKIRKIDFDRKRYHGMISDIPWGDRRGYHLCINTTDREIKSLIDEFGIEISAIQVKPKHVFGTPDEIIRFCNISGVSSSITSTAF